MADEDTSEMGRLLWATTTYSSRLLTELRVTNMKSLAGEHVIPLAPLTLIYGPNAAGKSSIIQSLLLMAQSLNADEFTPRGPLVDLHDFPQVVSHHDQDKELSIGVRFMVEEEGDVSQQRVRSRVDGSPGIDSIKFDAGVALTFHVFDHARSPTMHSSLSLSSVALVQPYPAPSVEGEEDDGRPYGPYFLQWKADLSDPVVAELLAEAIEVLQARREDVQGAAALIRYAAAVVHAGRAESMALECWVEPEDWVSGFHAPSHLRLALQPSKEPRVEVPEVPFEGRGLLPGNESEAKRMFAQWARRIPEAATFSVPKPIIDVFHRIEEEVRGLVQSPSLPEDTTPAARGYREMRQWLNRPEAQLLSLGPIRPTPQRVHLDDVLVDTAALTLIRRLHRNENLLARVNEWFKRLEIPYSVSVDRLVLQRSGAERGYSFELTDTRTDVEVSLADVGYGVSQVLPIVTECLAASSSVICIEQPELHLHPRLAADLAELLVESATQGNQIIAETHSENILLRVQRLIREGRIASEGVAVLYVDNNADSGASVVRLRLDQDGDLIDRWPGGFFDDRLADVLGTSPRP